LKKNSNQNNTQGSGKQESKKGGSEKADLDYSYFPGGDNFGMLGATLLTAGAGLKTAGILAKGARAVNWAPVLRQAGGLMVGPTAEALVASVPGTAVAALQGMAAANAAKQVGLDPSIGILASAGSNALMGNSLKTLAQTGSKIGTVGKGALPLLGIGKGGARAGAVAALRGAVAVPGAVAGTSRALGAMGSGALVGAAGAVAGNVYLDKFMDVGYADLIARRSGIDKASVMKHSKDFTTLSLRKDGKLDVVNFDPVTSALRAGGAVVDLKHSNVKVGKHADGPVGMAKFTRDKIEGRFATEHPNDPSLKANLKTAGVSTLANAAGGVVLVGSGIGTGISKASSGLGSLLFGDD
jgi:hypothetical protein